MEIATGTTAKILFKITRFDLQKYEKRSVFFSKPRLVGYYETNYDEKTPGRRISYLKEPKITQYPIDLNNGFETHHFRRQTISDKLNLCLKYGISTKEMNDSAVDNVERTLVYTRRGTLCHIMQSIYIKKHNDWNIKVSRYNGNLYMVRQELGAYKSMGRPVDAHHSRLERVLFADSVNELPKIDEPCDENIHLVGVHQSTLGKYNFVYSGEIQGILADEEFKDFDDMQALDKCHCVLTKQMWLTLKYDDKKYLTYWLQAYLANVKDIYLAFKNTKGVVEIPIERIKVSDLPKNRYWKPNVCTAFLHDFLKSVETLMSNVNSLDTVYVFHYNSNDMSISYEIYEGNSDQSFIGEDYMEYCKENVL